MVFLRGSASFPDVRKPENPGQNGFYTNCLLNVPEDLVLLNVLPVWKSDFGSEVC